MRNLVALALIATSGACEISEKRTPEPETTQPQYVVVNNKAGAGQMYRRSLIDGERDLSILAKVTGIEDAWMYVGDSLWIDIGDVATDSSVSIDFTVLGSVLNEIRPDTVRFYHTHPGPNGSSAQSLADINMQMQLDEAIINALAYHHAVTSEGVWDYRLSRKAQESIGNLGLYMNFREIKR